MVESERRVIHTKYKLNIMELCCDVEINGKSDFNTLLKINIINVFNRASLRD